MDSPFVPLHASTPFKQAEIRKSFAFLPFNLDNSDTASAADLDTSVPDSLHDSFESNNSDSSDIPLSVTQYLEHRSFLTVSQRISEPLTLKPIFNNQHYKVV